MDETKIITKLIEHDERLDRLEAKVDSLATRDEIFIRLDAMSKVLDRLDQERIFTVE